MSPSIAGVAPDLVSPRAARTAEIRAADRVDIVVVGAGLAGSAGAAALGRAGYQVALIDRHAVCPPQFRVEKFGGGQEEAFRRLGLLEAIATRTTAFETVRNLRQGKLVDHTHVSYHAIRYDDLVRAIRDQLPPTVGFVADEVVDIDAGPERQRVRLRGDQTIEARLVVLATGMADELWRKLGIVRRATFEKHSVTFGFDLARRDGGRLSLTYYGEGPIDYLTLFPLGDVVRANLFTFLSERDPRLRAFRRAPKETLLETMPGLAPILRDFEVISPVQSWVMTLFEAEGYERDGVVMIGDAFRTNCPAAGIGVTRLLTDVERLCAHAPAWLATEGMGREKIAAFYRDPAKQDSDRIALELSRKRRALSLEPGLFWRARREQSFLRRRAVEWCRSRAVAGWTEMR